MDGRTNGLTDGQMDIQTHRQMDKSDFKRRCPTNVGCPIKKKNDERKKMANNKNELKYLLWDVVYFNLSFLKNSSQAKSIMEKHKHLN